VNTVNKLLFFLFSCTAKQTSVRHDQADQDTFLDAILSSCDCLSLGAILSTNS